MVRSQLGIILWLRWCLTRNQARRAGTTALVLQTVFLGAAALGLLGGGVGAFYLGRELARHPAGALLLAWDVVLGLFVMLWVLMVITDIQRSEAVDVQRLMHLPVSLRQVFVTNYLSSLVCLSIVAALLAVTGLSLGMAATRGPWMLLMVPVGIGFLFALTAWTYCLQGWLVALMANKRRRRTIVALLGVIGLVLGQIPNLYFNVIRRQASGTGSAGSGPKNVARMDLASFERDPGVRVLWFHACLPLLWPAYGAYSLAEDAPGGAFGVAGGFLLLGTWGLRRAYRSTLRFYLGETEGPARRTHPGRGVENRSRFLERTLPFVPEPAGVLAAASFRALLRAPEVKLLLVMPVMLLVVFGGMFFFRSSAPVPGAVSALASTGAVSLGFLGLLQLLFNQFGFDRDGFRALVLLPVERWQILLGKNLACLPFALAAGVVFLAAVTVIARLSADVVVAAVLQLFAAHFLVCVPGNWLSVMLPYRVSQGSLKPTKMPFVTQLVMVVGHMLFPVMLLPVFVPVLAALLCEQAGWLPGFPVSLLLSVVLLVICLLGYWVSLGPTGRLLQGREKAILLAVSHDLE